MKPERWQQVREVLHDAMQMEGQERSAFLDSQCATDPSLRAELNELLAAEGEVGSNFLETPALAHATVLTDDSATGTVLAVGTKLGPYVVQALIGAGGMGEVYRARDSRLDRTVAIKIIPASLSGDGARRQRFEREARAISAFQHPNICTLYDVGQQDGTDYLVMEYLDGETLASRLARGHLTLEQVVTYGLEIADALDAAHRRGIIHRDLKPGNIFLTSHGECKVLDFGLAKLDEDSPDSPTQIQPEVLTSPGIAVGTVSYMSPEQARGEPLDARTDIFSLGTVLYEMATGKPAFPGKTSAIIFKAILDQVPPPPSEVNKSLPGRLDEVIGKCLEKDRELRYQSAAELRPDLKRIRRDSDSQKINTTVSAIGQRTLSEQSRSTRILAAGTTLLIVVGLVAYYWQKQPLANIAFQHYDIARLTTTGSPRQTSISRDGRFLVYAGKESEHYSLWVHQIATSTNVRVLGPTARGIALSGVRFSPDGTYIYFLQDDDKSESASLYRLPAVGGVPVKAFGGIDGGGAVSPDGSRISFVRANEKVTPPEYSLFTADIDGTNEQQIATLKGEILYGGAWSPDGKTLAVGIDELGEGNPNALAIVSLENKTQRRFAHHMVVFNWAWLSDGSGLVIVSAGPGRTGSAAALFQLWILSVPDGKVRKLTNDLNDYRGVSLTSDSMKLVSSQKRTTSAIWVAPTSDLAEATEITTGAGQQDGMRALSWLPDGRLLYMNSEAETQIFQMDRDGTNRQQLTHLKGSSQDVSVTADGATILFSHDMNIWRMNADGTNAKPVTNSRRDAWNSEVSPDGKWLAYYSHDAGPLKASMQGGDPTPLDPKGDYPAISRDGRWIAFVHWGENKSLIEILAADGSGSPRFLPFLPGTEVQQPDDNMGELPIRWTASGDAITFVRTKDGVSNLWSQPIDGGPSKQITNFTSGLIWRHAWSPDGKYLALTRASISTDAVLLTDLR